jgi:hypothetical protein
MMAYEILLKMEYQATNDHVVQLIDDDLFKYDDELEVVEKIIFT